MCPHLSHLGKLSGTEKQQLEQYFATSITATCLTLVTAIIHGCSYEDLNLCGLRSRRKLRVSVSSGGLGLVAPGEEEVKLMLSINAISEENTSGGRECGDRE